MTWQITIFVFHLFLTSFISLITGLYVLKYRHGAGSRMGSMLLLAGALWSLCYAMEITGISFATKLLWSKVQFVGKAVIGLGYLVYTLQYMGERWLTRRILFMLSVVPVTTLLLVSTNEYHRMIWSHIVMDSVNILSPLSYTFGSVYWVFTAYTYVMLLFASLAFFRVLLHSRRIYLWRGTALLICIFVPWLGSILYNFNLAPYSLDFTPLLLNACILAVSGINPERLYRGDIIPLARDTVILSMGDGVIVLDAQNCIMDMNTAAEQVIGHDLTEVSGQPIEEILPEWLDGAGAHHDEIKLGKEMTLHRGEERRTYDVNVSPILDWRGRLSSKIIVLRDITYLKITEEKLRRYSEHLEELVEERTERLRDAERLAAIGELAGMVGHDLRNPLTGIAGAVYYLKTTYRHRMDDKMKEMLRVIEDNVDYSSKIISDLLDYSRKIQLKLSGSNPKQLVEEALASVKVPENIRIVDLTEDQPRLEVDRLNMRRVLTNIIKNAVDSMPRGGELEITSRRGHDDLELVFKDTGKGIPGDILEKIWLHLFTTKAQGMGFGLAICKRMVEAHGGSISLESEVGEGTTVAVRLPIKGEPDAPSGRWMKSDIEIQYSN
ncbi:MAG: ATP-binding protein [Candidatus Bathyarchaeota archaeon]|nr:ATP-binding protein [Candidatus Bathyarchaeota archaeon]